eukprot:s965_g4.t3
MLRNSDSADRWHKEAASALVLIQSVLDSKISLPQLSTAKGRLLTYSCRAPSVRPTSAGPSRPPKPKPHRPLPEAPGSFHAPVSAEELPSVRRWKSSALSAETALASPGRNEGPELSKTAPAAVLGPDETSPVMSPRQEGGIGEGVTQTSLLRGTGLCIAVNIKQPSAPLSLEASPASGDVLLEPDPQVEVEQVCDPGVERVESPGPETISIEMPKGARLLEEGSRRLRENLQRLQLENRRHRVRPVAPSGPSDVEASLELHVDTQGATEKPPRHFEELRRKIAALEEASWAEEQRLRLEQKETQARRMAELTTLATSERPWMDFNPLREAYAVQALQHRWWNLRFIRYALNGADDVCKFQKWRGCTEDRRSITMGRPGFTKQDRDVIDGARRHGVPLDKGYFIVGPELPDISSTAVRKALQEEHGKPPEEALERLTGLLHPTVAAWLLRSEIYAPKG